MTSRSQPASDDGADPGLVAWQIGRQPRGTWSAAARCRWGRVSLIEVAPTLEGGEPFPTTFWLTCPHLVRLAGDLESAGAMATLGARVSEDEDLARLMTHADARYRERRARLAGGIDPCAGAGVAGQSDPLAIKCLHARVAAFLAGTGDPVGESALESLRARGDSPECGDDRCAGATSGGGSAPLG